MDLSVFDSIIFGTLQPWQVANHTEQAFYDRLCTSTRSVPATLKDLNTTNQILLRDYPNLYRPTAGSPNDILPAPLFEIALPKPFNATTEFYSLLMQCTALKFMHELTNTIQLATHDTEAYYIINSTLEKVKYLAAGAGSELQRQSLNDVPSYQTAHNLSGDETVKQNTHLILFVAKQITTRLFFEIEQRFKAHLKTEETQEQFFLHTLKEPAPQLSILTPTIAFYAWKVQQLIDTNSFSTDDVKALLTQLNSLPQSNTEIRQIQTVLENFVFSNLFEIEVDDSTIADYAKADTSKDLFNEVKQDIEKNIGRLDKGYKRLEIITTALDKLNIVPEKESQSAIGKMYKWLQQQQTLYTQLYIDKFPVATEETEIRDNKPQTKVSFGFTGDKAKLNNVIIELSRKVQLLNEDRSTPDELLSLLTSKKIKPASTAIYLGCETVQFRYIIDRLRTYFTNLTPTEIHKTKCFYSKKGNLIKSQNLYSNKVDTPKDQSIIDNIINHLQ
jgi:hypothetical protein